MIIGRYKLHPIAESNDKRMNTDNENKILHFMDSHPRHTRIIVTDAIRSLIEKSVEMIMLWRKDNPNANEADCISQCNLQMATCTAESILSLAKGIHWGYHNTFLIDIHSCASLVRSLYERAFIFRNIYVSTDNVLERDLLLYIWEIRGLNNRVTLKYVTESFRHIQHYDKNSVEELRRNLSDIVGRLDTTKSAREQISYAIKKNTSQLKGFKFVKDHERIIQFKSISLEESPQYFFKDDNMRNCYTYLSLTSHPSYLGILQFGQRYKERDDEKELVHIYLSLTYHLLSELALDFCNATTNAKKYYEMLYPFTERYIIEKTSC